MIGKAPDCVALMLAVILIILIFSSVKAQPGTIPAPTNSLQVFALPVGQGDCTFIQCPNGNIIVYDCGSSGGARMTEYGVQVWLNNSINRVSYILITHPHSDHHSYLPEIMWNYNALQGIIIGGELTDYRGVTRNWLNNYVNMVYMISNGQGCIGNNPPCVVNTGTNFCNDQTYQFSILAANVGNNADPNQKSIVMRVAVGGWSMLLSGDMQGAASTTIARQLGGALQSVVYKMSHHGATNANMVEWVTQINPLFAFASSGYNYGIYRHPTCVAIQTLLDHSRIGMTAGHQFYCGNGRNFPPSDFNNFQYNILETSPSETDICLLTYISNINIQPQADCWEPMLQAQQLTNETTYEEECEANSPAEGGGALCVAASYFFLATLALLCFIV